MLAPGTRIGTRYTIDNLLGQGGMSNLYLARDAQAGGAVRVIKEMTARYADPNEQRMAEQLFMREAQLLSTLNHPNIPKVFDKFTFQGKYYLSMDYVKGDDLGKIITQVGKPLEEKDVANWGHQMATVLYYLHRQNPPIVFRDVKPSNIMICGDQVKLIDFGIARMFTPAKKGDTMRIGSPGYAPPEQYSGQTDPRSDIYALGVTLHHALTGHDPTVSNTPFLIPPAKSLNPKISDEMVNIIAKATQLDPDKRYPSCIEMKRDLQVVMRKHGLTVGASMPLAPLSAPASSTAPTAAAGQASQPPVAAAAAAAAPAQAASTPSQQQPVAAPRPTPVQSSPNGGTATAARPGINWARWGAILFLGAGFAATAAMAPGMMSRLSIPTGWREAFTAFSASPALPTDSAEAATLLYKRGGPLPLVLELSQKAMEEHPAEGEFRIIYQNALALQAEMPVARWAVAVPENDSRAEMLRGLALAQKVLNDRGGVEQAQIVLEIGTYQSQNFAGAYRDALQGRWGRPQSPNLQGVLVFAEQAFPWTELLAGSSVPTYVVGPLSGAVPSGLRALSIPEKTPAEALKTAFSVDAGKTVWMLQKPARPEGMLAAPDGKLAATVKEKAAKLVVFEAEQSKAVSEAKLPADVKLCLWGDRPDKLAPASELNNLKLSALVPGSRFSSSDLQSGFYLLGARIYPDWKPTPRSGGGTAYDGLLWAAQQGGGKWAGVNVRVDAQGKIVPAPSSLFEIRGGQWIFVRNVE